MIKDIKRFLDYLKKEEFLLDYSIEEFEKYYSIVLCYNLSSVDYTERIIETDKGGDITTFLNDMLISASQIGSDIYSSLVDENDYFGYSSEEELEYRIDEEERLLNTMVDMYKYM